MSFRTVRADDLPTIHAINQAEVPAVGSETADSITHIVDQSIIALAAEADGAGTAVGFCLVLGPGADYGSMNYRWFSDRFDDFIYLDRVAIAPSHQARGIGGAMYAEVERLTRDVRPTATHFTLEVNLRPRNDGSLRFHRRLGFAEVGQLAGDDGKLVSLMAKPL